MKRKVAIVGAGVSGLTCAHVLRDAGYDVTIYADRVRKTTSSVAGGIWYPYDVNEDDEATAVKWGFDSLDVFGALKSNPKSTGISIVPLTLYGFKQPGWTKRLKPRSFKGGFTISVPLIETPIYLKWLRARRRIRIRLIESLDELTGEFDLVVNCTGMGARALCNDPELVPGRGVVLTVKYKGDAKHRVWSNPLTYIFPRPNWGDAVLGGLNDRSDDDDVSNYVQAILERCQKHEPSLPDQFESHVGFRPVRMRVRLERVGNIIHNYGHGGAGFTVSWGCAHEVLRLAQRDE